ncbi:MAG TPA: SPOR domain-containing protein [Dissulfurispiraceae bacterium]|nr:SPOR domain-containing protein [Dissulfurispiraceae bacterium]
MPFGRTRFFAGTALVLAALVSVVYLVTKDSGIDERSTAGPLPQETRSATTPETTERNLSPSTTSPPREPDQPEALAGTRTPAADENAGEARTAGQAIPTAPQRVSEVSRHVPPAAEKDAVARTLPPGQETPRALAQPEEGFVIQFGAYSRMEAAERTQKTLLGHGAEAKIVEYGGIFRVRVGPFKAKQQAEEVAGQLQKDSGLTYLITKQ